MEISGRYCKINAQFELPQDLTIGRDYQIELTGSITACTEKDAENGTFEREYRFKSILGAIKDDLGATIKLTDKTRKSVKLRGMITMGMGLEYDDFMNVLLSNSNELREFYEKHKV